MQQTDHSLYNNQPYHPGGTALKRALWYYTNALFLQGSLFPSSSFKVFLLRLFGAKIGSKAVIRRNVNVKYPWHLTLGNHAWIGENVWIDCLVPVTLGDNVCLSQGAVILTGSHNYKKPSFDLLTAGVCIEDGVWIGACAIVNLGITAKTHAVLTSGSVATKNLEAYAIYQGNPAVEVRSRIIS